MVPPDKPRTGRAAVTALVIILLVALAAGVVYLLSDINSRRYRIAAEGTSLVIERGRKLPWGFRRFESPTPELGAAYAPIAVPPGETLGKTEVYEDRADVDRALFSMLAGWVRSRLESKNPGDFDLAQGYVRRSELLPSLSEEQRLELKRLRADLAYRNGRRMLDDIADRLQKSLAELKLARELGATKQGDVDRWISEVERRLRDYNVSPPVLNPALPAEAPAAAPSPAPLQPAVPAPVALPPPPGKSGTAGNDATGPQ